MLFRTLCLGTLASILILDTGVFAGNDYNFRNKRRLRLTATSHPESPRGASHRVASSTNRQTTIVTRGNSKSNRQRSRTITIQIPGGIRQVASDFWDALFDKPKPQVTTTTPPPTQPPLQEPNSGQQIRLRGNGAYYNLGRVEIYRAGKWGLVCDDQWDIRDAIVACKQLGFRRGALRSHGRGNESATIDPEMEILMDEVNCQGSENALHQCQYKTDHDCLLTETAAAICYPNQGCPKGWMAGYGKCYKFFRKAKGIKNAAKTCANHNGTLLQIDSVEENHFLSSILKTTRNSIHTWWTSGKQTKGVWKWHKTVPRTISKSTKKRKSNKSSKKKNPTGSSKSTKRRKLSKFRKPTKQTRFARATSKKQKSSRSSKSTKAKNKKGKGTNKSGRFRTRTIRQKVSTDKWFPGWPSHGNSKAEPTSSPGLDCLVLSDVFYDPTDEQKITEYFFWKAAPCRQKSGIDFICQLESEDAGAEECYNGRGEDYRGYVQVTKSGSNCLKWTGSNMVNETSHPRKGLGDHNFCRNPDNDTRPWCWVNHKTLTFGHCLLQPCKTTQAPRRGATTTPVPDLNCPDGEFYCNRERVCLPGSFRCDNEQDCTYGEDEEGCNYMLNDFNKTKNSALRLPSRRHRYSQETYLEVTDEQCARSCVQNTNFNCRSFTYDSLNRVCNLSRHDSSYGQIVSSPTFDYYEHTKRKNCSGLFRCSNGLCIERSQRCDGIDQCNDLSDELSCKEKGDDVTVTLVGGEENSGTVQLSYRGVTGVVCDNGWSMEDAHVVCRMVGYRGASAFFIRNHFQYPPKDVVFLLDDVKCSGNETSIADCNHGRWKKHKCKAYAIAGVECQLTKACEDDQFKCPNGVCLEASAVCDGRNDCMDQSDEKQCSPLGVALVDSVRPWEGRVQITRNGMSGTICDDQWDDQDATVICTMLGYRYGGTAILDGRFGEGTGPIWLDNVFCSGKERSIALCPSQGWGRHDCNHAEDAAVHCYRFPPTTVRTTTTTTPTTTTTTTTPTTTTTTTTPTTTTTTATTTTTTTPRSTTTTTTTTRRPTTKKLKPTPPLTTIKTTAAPSISFQLVGGSKPSEGNVEILLRGRRFSVCDDNWDDREAQVICRMMGYAKGGAATGRSTFGVTRSPVILDEVSCTGQESSLIDCRAVVGTTKHDCSLTELAGVKCTENIQTTPVSGAIQGQAMNVSGVCGRRPYDRKDLFSRKKRSSDAVPEDLHAPRTLAKENVQKIIRGRTADHGANPWQARLIQIFSVFQDGSYYGSHSCGAAIISEFWVLSAAHCFIKKRKSQFRVAVGDHHKKHKDKGEQIFSIEEIFIHPKYQETAKDYDIALLKIKPISGKGIEFNDFVQPACLPDAKTPFTQGQQCIVSGWGSSERGDYPDTLKFAYVPLLSWNHCRRLYDPQRTGFFSRRMFCAGYLQGGIDTCDGDSGGPLVCRMQDSFILVGLTSWGRGCGQPNSPGVYAKVDEFLDWISATIDANSISVKQKGLPPRLMKN